MLKKKLSFLFNEQGATAIEYGLIVGLIAAVIVVILTSTGTSISSLFGVVESAVASAAG
jgi:pilus assembly protein Flp/PilA